ncbi:MAG: hypothetical protein KJ600_03800 [Nanoarchaeota archaeon]|nr:hypothetical protein [Nanoarchaeota archaeon]MBU1103651.1 hypothetical protein [Nanoarchaeota archaeon]
MLPFYCGRLVAIRQIAAAVFEEFPKGKCCHVARAVFEVTGLLEVAGKSFTGAHHAWNIDPNKKIYADLGMGQFGDYPDIALLPLTTRLLIEDPIATRVQRLTEDKDLQGMELFRKEYRFLLRRN